MPEAGLEKELNEFKRFYHGQKITVIGAITRFGCLAIKTIDKGMNGSL